MNHQEECRQHDGNHFDLLSTSVSSDEVNPRIPVPEDRVSTLVRRQRLLDPRLVKPCFRAPLVIRIEKLGLIMAYITSGVGESDIHRR